MSFSSNSVTARARAVFGRALTAQELTELSEKRSVSEAAAFLKGTQRYGAALRDIEPALIHRGQLETLLSKTVFNILGSFRRFDFTESKWFFRQVVTRLEAEQVLYATESVADGSTYGYIAALPEFLIKESRLDLLELGRAKSFADISERLAGTDFGRVLEPLLREAQSAGKINIRECERRLYTHYYLTCMKTVNRLFRGAKKDELRRAILKSIDMKNVVTCCRMRAFGYDADSAGEKLLPFRYRLSPEAVSRLMQEQDISRIESRLAELGYRTDGSARFQTVEQLTDKISLDFFRRTLRISQNSSTVYFCLIECLETELQNVKTITEGIRYGIPSAEIREMLVL